MTVTRAKLLRSGFCINGQCEGTKPTSPSGVPMIVCTAWDWCKCKCHKQISELYEMAGLPRETATNPDYHPKKRDFWLPGDPETMPEEPLSSSDVVMAPGDMERPPTTPPSPARGTLAAVPVRTFAPTPTGRRARGQLEYDVLSICRQFADLVFDWEFCTPKLVSEQIGRQYAIEPPSTGAINAVWDRWERLEFATQDKKPSRFVKFSGDGTESELDKMKLSIKRAKRRGEAELRRGIRPPQPRK